MQERAYQTSKEAQARVIQQAQNYDPRYTVNTNPDAVNGPPIVTPDGTVLGGNSRTMSTQRLYSRGQGNAYRNYLSENAQQFGISPEAVGKMRNPVLVREIAAPADVEAARRLGSELNKNMTESITPQSLSAISTMLDDLGPESSIRDLLRERGREVMTLLTRDGAITERERPQFIDTATGGLSEEGKQFAERALLGTVVDDPTLMELRPNLGEPRPWRVAQPIAGHRSGSPSGKRTRAWCLMPSGSNESTTPQDSSAGKRRIGGLRPSDLRSSVHGSGMYLVFRVLSRRFLPQAGNVAENKA